MPVIAASVVNKGGRIILSRQFTDITRIRIEGLLSAFPKLLSTSTSKQYTVIETESVRYVYQPIEEMFLVVLTTKSSNIVEDLATLRLLGRLIPEYCPQMTEETIGSKAFEILFAFDEVVTCGYRENVTMEQVISIMEMHSHEEELALEEKKKAEQDAVRHAKAKAKELAEKRRENVMGEERGSHAFSASSFTGGSVEESAPTKSTFSDVAEDLTPARKATPSLGGMALGKQKKTDATAKMLAEMGISGSPKSAPEPQKAAAVVPTEPFNVKISEKFKATLNRDGGASAIDISGDLSVTVVDGSLGAVKIVLGRLNKAFTFKSHPNINKPLFTSDNVLLSKDGKPYPLQQSLGILRWRCQQTGAVKIPISINCWPSESGVSVEYELENQELSLTDVVITVPIGDAFPSVDECSVGRYTHDGNNGVLQWHIPSIDQGANDNGTLEISLNKEVNADVFFPTQIDFSSATSVAGVSCAAVTDAASGEKVVCSVKTEMVADEYVVQ